MAIPAMNLASSPLKGHTTLPTGSAKFLSWDAIESALRRAGEVSPSESVPCFIVSDDGVHVVLERNR